MRRLKSLIAIIMCTLCSAVLFSCQDKKGDINLTNESITIYEGQTYDIDDIVELTDAQFSQIDFSSSNNGIAHVTADKKIVGISDGSAVITAKLNDITRSLTVVVLNNPVNLSTPNNLHYDEKQGKLVWSNVYAKIEDDIFDANSYSLSITKDSGAESFVNDITTNSYAITEAGTYKVKVKTNQRNTYILGSEWSQPITFTILAPPTSVAFDISTQTLSWRGNADKYAVSVDNVKMEVSGLSKVLNLATAKTYEICVYSLSNSGAKQAKSEVISVTRLAKPTLTISNGVINWAVQTAGKGFEVVLKDGENNEQIVNLPATQTSYSLENINWGTYTIKIRAKGDTTSVLASEYSEAKRIDKLEKVNLVFDASTREFSAVNASGTDSITVWVTLPSGQIEQKTLNTANNWKYVFEETFAGNYSFVAKRMATTQNEINSDVSNTITINQLAKVENYSLTINENIITATFDNVANATSYIISKKLGSGTPVPMEIVETTGKNRKLGNVNTLFADAGTYQITVSAIATSATAGHYVLPSNNTKIISRLANVTASYSESNGLISWTKVNGATSYDYQVWLNGESILSGTTALLSFDTKIYNGTFGNYTFKIVAKESNLVLPSLTASEVTFDKTIILDAPQLVFDKSTKILTLNYVENATNYEVLFDDSVITVNPNVDDQNKKITYDLITLVATAGVYTIEATASSTNILILPSDSTTIKIEKLSTPTKMYLSENETISIDSYSAFADPNDAEEKALFNTKVKSSKPYSIRVNGEESSSVLGQNGPFNISVKYIANETVENNIYYLDSDVKAFVLTRLVTPAKPYFADQKINWENINNVEQEYSTNLIVEQIIDQEKVGGTIFVPGLTNIPADGDAVKNIGVSLSLPYTIKVQYGFGNLTITTDTAYISSATSESITVEKLVKPSNVKVETDGTTKVVWDENEKADKYKLIIVNPNDSTIEIDEIENNYYAYDFAAVGEYTVYVQAFATENINSEISQAITVERLDKPKTCNVTSEGVLTINNEPSSPTKRQQTKFELKVGSQERVPLTQPITLLNNDNEFTIYAKFIAKVNTSGLNYYLDSAESAFNFARIEKMNPVTFSEGNIIWSPLDTSNGYVLTFTQGQKSETIDIADKNLGSISVESNEVKNVLVGFTQGEITIQINPIRNSITNLNADSLGNLSCLEKSTASTITMLEPTTNNKIKAIAGDVNQTTVDIMWQHDTVGVSSFKIFVDDNAPFEAPINTKEVDGQIYCFATVENFAITAGTHSVYVMCVGAEGYIQSVEKTPFNFTRLACPQTSTFSFSKTATANWETITNAESYNLFYKFEDKWQCQNVENSSYDALDLLKNGTDNLVTGDTAIKIQALGNGQSSLTSVCSEEYTINVLEKPDIEFSNTHYFFAKNPAGYTYPAGTKIYFTIKKDGDVVPTFFNVEKDLEEYVTLPEDLTAGDYTVEFYASCDNHINSDLVIDTFTKNNPVTDIGIEATGDGQDTIKVKWKHEVNGNADYGMLINNANVNFGSISTENGFLVTTLDNSYLTAGDYKIEIIATGTVNNGGNYINSKKAEYTFTRLNPPTNLSCNESGMVSWNRTDAESYKIYYTLNGGTEQTCVPTENPYDFNQKLKNGSELLTVGLSNIKIQAIGNGTRYLTSSVSDGISINVLEKPQLTILSTSLSAAGTYPYPEGTKISLTIKKQGEEIDKTDLNVGEQYTFNTAWLAGVYDVECFAYLANNISSDITTGSFTKLAVATDLFVEATGDNQTHVNVYWKHDNVGVEKFELYVNNIKLTHTSVLKTKTINERGEFFYYEFDDIFNDAGNYNIYVEVIGDTTGGTKYITSENSQSISFTRLSNPTNFSYTKDAKLNWTKVEGSVSYNIDYILPTTDSGKITDILSTDIPYNFTSTLTHDGQLYDGVTKVTLQAIGDGTTYLTSAKTTEFDVVVLKKPILTIANDKMSATGELSSTYPEGTLLYLTVVHNNGIETKLIDNQSQQLGEDFVYPNENPNMWPAGGTITVSYYASIDGCINSDAVVGTFTKLEAATDVCIQATNDNHTAINLYWKHDLIGVREFHLYDNGVRIANIPFDLINSVTNEESEYYTYRYFNLTGDNAFNEVGEHSISIDVIADATGDNKYINSLRSANYNFERLAGPTNVGYTSSAVLSWDVNHSAENGYKIYYTVPAGEEQFVTVDSTQTGSIEFRPYIQNAATEKLIDGITFIKIQSVGNGKTLLSSAINLSCEMNVLKSPEITLDIESMTVGADYQELQDVKMNLSIERQSQRLISEQVFNNNDVFVYPTTIDWAEGNYSAYCFASKEGCVNSDAVSKSFKKLPAPDNLYFIKVQKTNSDYDTYLRASKVLKASGYKLIINEYSTTDYDSIINELNYLVSNALENALEDEFTINIKSVGGEVDDVFYISSNVASISGTKLAAIEEFKAVEGLLTWTKNPTCSGYRMMINSEVRNIDNPNTITDELLGYSGDLVLNIKSLGNVGTVPKSENVILDSTYIGRFADAFEETNYNCYKLPIVNYFAVDSGYIAFRYLEDVKYVITVDNGGDFTRTYNDDQLSDMGTDSSSDPENRARRIYCQDMYNDLSANVSYSLNIKMLATLDDVLNSDFRAELNKIKVIIPNTATGLTWKLKVNIDDGTTNLAESFITWDAKEDGDGYIVNLAGTTLPNIVTNVYPAEEIEKAPQSFAFSVAIKGGSSLDEDGNYVMNSHFCEQKLFKKLALPTIKIEDGILTWNAVDDATGYYVYLNGNVYNNTIYTKTNLLDISPLDSGFYNIDVRAVTTVEDIFQSNISSYKKGQEYVNVRKLFAPVPLLVENGTLYWDKEIGYMDIIALALSTYVKDPFTFNIANVAEQEVVLEFKTGSSTYTMKIPAVLFLTKINPSISSNENIIAILEELEIDAEPLGWPTSQFLFDYYGKNIPAGAYTVSIKQLGNDEDYITSPVAQNGEMYVPHAPTCSIVYEQSEDDYYISWKPVAIPSHFNMTTTYQVYGKKMVEEKMKNILLGETTSTRLNLTSLIEDGTLTTDFEQLFVIVKGDSTTTTDDDMINVLCGKTSNLIDIEVLPIVNARIINGVLEWDAEEESSGYLITYTGGSTGGTHTYETTKTSWDMNQLDDGYTYTNVMIKALGSKLEQTTKFVIAGQDTNIGTIHKLAAPAWYIKNGVFEWNNVNNSVSYMVKCYDGVSGEWEEEPEPTTLEKSNGTITSYETDVSGEKSYSFRSNGTINLALTSETTGYINSNYSSIAYTFKHGEVADITCENGVLIWSQLSAYNSLPIKNYKLIFRKQGTADIIINLEAINNSQYTGYSLENLYNYGGVDYKNLLAGQYSVYIQGYAKGSSNEVSGNDANMFEEVGSKNIYLLLSQLQVEAFGMKKLEQVTDIQVYDKTFDGHQEAIVEWRDIEGTTNSVYELTFTSTTGGGNVVIRTDDETREGEFVMDDGYYYWRGVLINNIEDENINYSYNLKIRRLATEATEMNSDYVTLSSTVGEDTIVSVVSQINPISSTNIATKLIGENNEFVISWEDYVPTGIEESKLTYLFEYYTTNAESVDSAVTKAYIVGTKYILFNSLTQPDGTVKITYRVQVLIGDGISTVYNMLNSRFTRNFEISTPDAVGQIMFDVTTQSYTWSYVNNVENKDLKFIIKDYYIGTLEEDVTDITDLTDYTRSEYYINIKSGEAEYSFMPRQIGYHLLSIEVAVSNLVTGGEFSSGLFKSAAKFFKDASDVYSRQFNMFESGDGTSANPYIIKTEAQFNNMKYRLDSPSYFGEQPFFYKQGANLTINCGTELVNDKNVTVGFINDFNSNYDGDLYKLEIVTTISELNGKGGLFATLNTRGVLQNLNVILTMDNVNGYNSPINTAILVGTNKGKIENCRIGDNRGIVFNAMNNDVKFAALVSINEGIIDKCINYYSITVTLAYNASITTSVGGIAIVNKATLQQCGNEGTISVTSYGGAVVGGLVASVENGIVDRCYNKGVVSINYNSNNSNAYLVGGIVGYISGGNIKNSYATGTMNIITNNTNPNEVSVGGIVGKSTYTGFINNNYANVTFVTSGTSNILKSFQIAGNVVSRSSTSNVSCYISQGSANGGEGLVCNTVTSYTQLRDLLNSNDDIDNDVFVVNQAQTLIKFGWEDDFGLLVWKN